MKQGSSLSTPWFYTSQRRAKARLRLFCFPYAGGGASIFHAFTRQLPEEIEVWPVQLPGRENRFQDVPFSNIGDLLGALEGVLFPYLDMPYAFFGHSMGALISFELAHSLRLKDSKQTPLHLFVSGHRAPHLPDPQPPIHHLPDSEFLEELHRFNGTPAEVLHHQELLQLLLPLLRADFALCETYTYIQQPPLACPISAFGGLQDEYVSPEALRAWCIHTCKGFQAHFFRGNHFFLRKEEKALIQLIAQILLNDL